MIGDILSAAKAVVEPISWALIHSLWQDFIIAGILIISMSVLRNANSRLRYLMACGAMMIMFLTAIFTFAYKFDNNSYSFTSPGHAINAQSSMIGSGQFTYTKTDDPTALSGHAFFVNSGNSSFMTGIFSFWLLGVIIVSVYNLLAWRKTRYLVSTDTGPADNYWQTRFNEICDKLKLKRKILLVQSALVKTPCVVGWIKPVILAPASILTGLNASYLELILAHEIAHVKRYDIMVNYIQTFIETLLFFNPFVWWISNQIRLEREHCCDDIVVENFGDRIKYAHALADLESFRIPGPVLAIGADGGKLLPRIKRLVSSKNESRYRPGIGATLITIASLLLIFSISFLKSPSSNYAYADTISPGKIQIPPADYSHEGRWEAQWYDDEIALRLDFNRDGNSTKEVWADELIGIEKARETKFTLSRDAGIFYFDGGFDKIGNESLGSGICYFVPNKDYFKELGRIGYSDSFLSSGKNDKKQQLHLAIADLNYEYARQMKDLGYSDLSLDRLITLFYHGVNPEFITGLADAGYKNLDDDQLLRMRDHGVDPWYISELAHFGFKDIAADDLVKYRDHGVDGSFMSGLAKFGYTNLDLDELLRMRDHGVDGYYIDELTKYGYDDFSATDLVTLRDHGVDGYFISDLDEQGYKGLQVSLLRKMRDHGVDGSFISGLAEYGYNDLDPSMLIKMRDHGVDSGYISQLVNLGYRDLSPSMLIKMKDHGVSPDFIKRANDDYGRQLPPERLIKFRDSGIY